MNISTFGLLWDLDGTIIDSTDCHFETWAAVLEDHGHTISRDLFDANFGRNTQSTLPIFLGYEPAPELSNQIRREKEILFRKLVSQRSSLVTGVRSWLTSTKEMGLKQAIASSAPMKNISSMLEAFDLIDYFDLLVSGADLPAKPEPDVFLVAADQLNLSPEKCLVIEDSAAGVAAAKRAGMTCIAVLTSHSESQLASADLIIKDFKRPLLSIINDLFSGV